MERMWEQSIYGYLRAEPENHYMLLVRIVWGTLSVANLNMLDGGTAESSGKSRVHSRDYV